MKLSLGLLTLFFSATTVFAAAPCQKPKVINPMKNWEIIATNTASIPFKEIFSGSHLSYSISAHPANLKNKVSLLKKDKFIIIAAEKKDNFDVTIRAKNQCGSTSNKFNVLIDEEE